MKKYRKLAGLSQERLAELCESSHSHIRQIECGSKYPSFGFITKLAVALNVPPSLLFADENEERAYGSLRKAQIEQELIHEIEDLKESVHTALSKI